MVDHNFSDADTLHEQAAAAQATIDGDSEFASLLPA